MFHLRVLEKVRITKVKGHAEEGMVLDGRVREVDRLGNDAADEAADLVVGELVLLSLMLVVICLGSVRAGTLLFLIFIDFFIAISRAVVNHDDRDGTAPDPLVWSAGALPKRRRLVHAVRDRAFLPWPLGIWYRNGFVFLHLPFVLRIFLIGPILLVSWSSGLLSWAHFIGLLVVWILELVVFLMRNCSRLSLEKAHPRYLRPGRPISVSVVLFGQALIFGVPVASLVL